MKIKSIIEVIYMSVNSMVHPEIPYMKQLTNPLWSLFLAPLSYSFLGFFLAIKTNAIPLSGILVLYFFLFMINLQEMMYSKFYKIPKRGQSVVLLFTNFLLLLPIVYFVQTFGIRIGIIAALVVGVNHSWIFHLQSNHPAYAYHVLLNSLAKFTVANFLMYYLITQQITNSIFQVFLCYAIFGISIIQFKQKANERHHSEKLEFPVWSLFLSFIFNLCWLFAYPISFYVIGTHFSLFALILIGISGIVPILYHILLKKTAKPSRISTYFYWYATLLTFLIGIFYQF